MEHYLEWVGAPFQPRPDAELVIELVPMAGNATDVVYASIVDADTGRAIDEITVRTGVARALGAGLFAIPVATTGRESGVLIRSPGRSTFQLMIPDGRARTPQDAVVVRLEPTIALSGSVVDESGAPVAGALVDVRPTDDAMTEGRFHWTAPRRGFRTDAHGRFRAADFARRIPICVTVHSERHRDPPATEVTIGDVDFTVPPITIATLPIGRGAVRGIVRDAVTRAPIESATVTASIAKGPSSTATSGPDGAFTVSGLDGPAKLRVMAPDHLPGFVDDAPIDSESPLEIALERGFSIDGVVVDGAHAPVPGAFVSIHNIASPAGEPESRALAAYRLNGPRRTFSDASGRFQFAGLPRADCSLVASIDGAFRSVRDDQTPPLQLRADVHGLELPLAQNCVIAGTVTDAASGAPVTRFTLEVSRVGGSRSGARETGNGKFCEFVPADVDHTVTVMAAGFASERREGVRVAAGEIRELSFAMTRECAVDGRLVDERGAPLAGATVALASVKFGEFENGESVTDADGRFHVSQLRSGAVAFVANARFEIEGGGTITRPLALTPASVDLAIGQLLTQTFVGRPRGGDAVLVLDVVLPPQPAGGPWHVILFHPSMPNDPIIVETDRSRTVRITPIEPGTWSVGANVQRGNVRIGIDPPAEARRVTVGETGETTLRIELPAPKKNG